MAKKIKQSNYLAACQKLGLTPKEKEEHVTYSSDGDEYDYHTHVLRVCVDAENAIEQPDGTFKVRKAKKDGTEITYSPWFRKSGSGWVYYGYANWHARTIAGPRLEYFEISVMKSAVKKLSTEYNNYFNS